MPILRNNMILVVRGIKAFLNLEAGITRSAVPQSRQGRNAPAQPRPKPAINRLQPAAKPEQARRRRKQIQQQRTAERDGGNVAQPTTEPTGETGGIAPENIVWLFGHGRSGGTWIVRMMRDLKYTVWPDPRLGDLFGHLYYERADDRLRSSSHFILGSDKELWLGPMRSFILDSARLRFPHIKKGGGIVVIKEHHATIGAPLLMEALPESRMIVLVRDPRDIVASHLDAYRPGGWVHERTNNRRIASLATTQPEVYAHSVAESCLRDIEKAKQAYDAFEGPKVLIRYEDLVSDTLGTMQRLCSELGLAVDEKKLVRAVEKRSWENIPEEEKGEGKFHRKGTPGGWKDDLTRQLAEKVEAVTAPILDEFYPSTERVLPFVFRPGTQDGGVFRSVNVRNEYRLPDSFQADDIIVDIGANIGSFCYAALQRGSDNVYGYEPEKDNYACAVRNLGSFGDRVRLYNKAVWRSDRVGDRLLFNPASDEVLTASGNVLADSREEMETVAFDDVIQEITANGNKRVKMLKIDCEGSEFPILFTSQSLHLIDEIRGEFHEFGGEYDDRSIPEVAKVSGYDRFTIAELTEALQQAGFSVESTRGGNARQGHFFATRVS